MITAHMIVQNEEQWVWYAIQSVIDFVDAIIIFDTGSTDKTVEIITSIQSKKINFQQKTSVTPEQLVRLRNEQITLTKTRWFMLLDGDEIWTNTALNEAKKELGEAHENIICLVSPVLLPIGDVYHVQSESAGKYSIKGKRGHFNIRFYRKNPQYKWCGLYPNEAYSDDVGVSIQKKSAYIDFLREPYWHMTHMYRSSSDTHKKRKLEIGKKIVNNLPEIFYKSRPQIVSSPWISFTFGEKIIAHILSPLLSIKRYMQYAS